MQGRLALELENASVRFVQAVEGRPEGLGGLDLHAVDPQRAFAAAEARGLRSQDDVVVICGTRLRLT